MPPAIIGGAIAGVGAIGSAVIGSSAAKSAANTSAAAADKAAQLQQQQYQQNAATLAPYVNAGLPATQQINALLGLGGTAGTAGTPATPGHPDYAAYVQANPDLMADVAKHKEFGGDLAAYGQWHYNTYGQNEPWRGPLPMTGGTEATPGTSGVDASAAAGQAFDTYRNSTGYDFRVKQGMNALNSGYAGAGTIKSGAAIKGAVDYGQGMASQEFGNYLNALGTQQGVGLSAAGAQAGVSTNYANSLGNIYMQNGANQANASLAKASALGNGLSSIANIGGSILGQTGGGSGGVNMNAFNALVANNNYGLARWDAGMTK